MERVRVAALDGVIATVPQTLVQAAGLLGRGAGRLPPQEVAGALAERAGLPVTPGRKGFHPFWVAAHLAYGAGLGVAHRVAATRGRAGSPAAGVAFGAVVWAVHYVVLLPALRLYPAPRGDRPSRRRANMVAHGVFGLTLGMLERRRG
jgi:hypothetical protein